MEDQSKQPNARAAAMEAVGGPVSAGWRECTLTRVKELDTLCALASAKHDAAKHDGGSEILVNGIAKHLAAAKDAAELAEPKPKPRLPSFRRGALHDRAMSNLDAAEAQLLSFADADYVIGQFPGLLAHVQRHLIPTDPRRTEFERLARHLGAKDKDQPAVPSVISPRLIPGVRAGQGDERARREQERRKHQRETVNQNRGQIVTSVRAASSAALREQVRVRSFRDVLVVTTLLMTLLGIGIAIIGAFWPTLIPLCFAPEDGGRAVVVCPTAQSAPFPTSSPEGTGTSSSIQSEDIDDAVRETVTGKDLAVVELIGLAAASVAAAAAVRKIRGSSERYGLPVALAVLKLPTGAITAFLGLLLMRGQFVPGLSALDTSAQILAWALVFGYAQQLFTRLVDQQGQTVLNSVRGADKAKPDTSPP